MVLAVLVVAALSANGQHLELPWLCIHSALKSAPKGNLTSKNSRNPNCGQATLKTWVSNAKGITNNGTLIAPKYPGAPTGKPMKQWNQNPAPDGQNPAGCRQRSSTAWARVFPGMSSGGTGRS